MKGFYNRTKAQVKGIFSLRIAALIVVGFFLMTGQLHAQCYENNRSRGITAMNNKEYDKAIGLFTTAKSCPDKPSSNDLDAKIKECKRKKQQEIDEKKEALEKKKKAAALKQQEELEQQRRAEAMEAELQQQREMEERMAEKGYMDIIDITFVNANYMCNPLSQSGTILYDEEVQYIQPRVTYDALADEIKTANLYIKYLRSDETPIRLENSPIEFSQAEEVSVYPGNNNEIVLPCFGSSRSRLFQQGVYRFELWANGNRFYSTSFRVYKMPPKDISVSMSVPGNATIVINGMNKGNGSWSGSLPAGNYTIVCRKEGHEETTTPITLTEGMSPQTFTLPEPKPMYGAVLLKTKPKSAEVLVDGNKKGETPTLVENLLVGDHSFVFKKDGYETLTTTVTITKDKTINKEYQLTRLPYENHFASFFLDGVIGNLGDWDNLMIGGQMAICPRRVGFYGQYLHGTNYSTYLATGGLVFRLTRDHVDLQLNVGGGYGKMYAGSSYYPYSYYNYRSGAMVDLGGRIGWRSFGWSMFDIMGGCVISTRGDIYPYAGVGTALSLTAVLLALSAYNK